MLTKAMGSTFPSSLYEYSGQRETRAHQANPTGSWTFTTAVWSVVSAGVNIPWGVGVGPGVLVQVGGARCVGSGGWSQVCWFRWVGPGVLVQVGGARCVGRKGAI